MPSQFENYPYSQSFSDTCMNFGSNTTLYAPFDAIERQKIDWLAGMSELEYGNRILCVSTGCLKVGTLYVSQFGLLSTDIFLYKLMMGRGECTFSTPISYVYLLY